VDNTDGFFSGDASNASYLRKRARGYQFCSEKDARAARIQNAERAIMKKAALIAREREKENAPERFSTRLTREEMDAV
jgi:hypothetical protein